MRNWHVFKRKRMFSLRYKILIFSFFMVTIPILIVGSFSYIKSTEIVKEQANRLNMEIIKQIANNIEFIINDVRGISFNLIENKKLSEYLKTSDFHRNPDVFHVLDEYILTKKYIYSIYVQDLNGNGVDTQGAINLLDDRHLSLLYELNGKEKWFLNQVRVIHKNFQLISLSRLIRDVNNLDLALGVLTINLSQEQIRNIYLQKVSNDDELFFMIDQNGIILSSQADHLIGQTLDDEYTVDTVFEKSEGYYNAVINDTNYLVVFYTIKETGWKLLHFVPNDRIVEQSKAIKQITIISISLSLFICFIFLFFFMFKVLKPLRQIRKLMQDLAIENFNVTMNIQGNDEIALLAHTFNKMSQKLNTLFNEVHIAKIKQKEAEIKALEEQINPHFLYNTLDLIYWMGRMEKAYETAEMIQTLSKLFRLGLNSGSGFTTVKRELEYIQHYMTIQQKRYENAITFTIDASPETLDLKVIKLILQPIVENAITHGIEKKEGKGRIDVRVFCSNHTLIYEVEDDGVGMTPELIQEVLNQEDKLNTYKNDRRKWDLHKTDPYEPQNPRKGIGLKNINDRIQLTFGTSYGLEIQSELDKGTKVIVKQPILKGEMN